jgi:hypothetical protein
MQTIANEADLDLLDAFVILWEKKFLILALAAAMGAGGFLVGGSQQVRTDNYTGTVLIEMARYVDDQGRIQPLEIALDLGILLTQVSQGQVKTSWHSTNTLLEIKVHKPDEAAAKAELEKVLAFVERRHSDFTARLNLPSSRFLVKTHVLSGPTYKLGNSGTRGDGKLAAVAGLCLGAFFGAVVALLSDAISRRKAARRLAYGPESAQAQDQSQPRGSDSRTSN